MGTGISDAPARRRDKHAGTLRGAAEACECDYKRAVLAPRRCDDVGVLGIEPSRDWIALLQEDESLAAAVAPETLAAALPACLATADWFGPGPWQPRDDLGGPGCLGLLVLEGFLVRYVDVVGRPATELLGPGDLLRPWDADRTEPFSSGARWQMLEPCRLALLDERVCAVIGRWPDLVAALVGRALARSREQAITLAVGQIPSMRLRLLVVLWHLAGRWGEPVDDGTLMPVRLTHELLANLTSAQRPSVSHALTALRRRGLVERMADGRLVLRGDPPSALGRLRQSLA
jgi:DNA-binding transcriptional ArsR family regulator